MGGHFDVRDQGREGEKRGNPEELAGILGKGSVMAATGAAVAEDISKPIDRRAPEQRNGRC